MAKYSILQDDRADEIIDFELNLITESISSVLGNYLKAILLVGGFGRGEGSVVKTTGGYRPLNDYDLVVVVKRWQSIPEIIKQRLLGLEEELNEKVTVKQVDLLYLDEWKLTVPSPSIERYEIEHGHKVLKGRLRTTIRSFPRRYIPLFEGTRYFRNRAIGLLIAKLLLDGAGNFGDDERKELVFLEINKAFLVLGDAYLIKNRCYHYSYLKRKEIVVTEKLNLQIPDTVFSLYVKAVDDKLVPNIDFLDEKNLTRDWSMAVRNILAEFLKYESYRYGVEFDDLTAYKGYMIKNVINGFRVARFFRFYNREDNLQHSRQRLFVMCMLKSLLEGRPEKEIDSIRRIMNFQEKHAGNEWRTLVLQFLEQWHPHGIIKKLMTTNKEKKRHIAIVLGSQVMFGGGFQYALTIVNALCSSNTKEYRISIVTRSDLWNQYLSSFNVSFYKCNESSVGKAIRKITYLLPGGVRLWRDYSVYVNNLYALLSKLEPDIVVFPTEAHFSLGWKGKTVVPIHDLMHRYERRFPEVGSKKEFVKREFVHSHLCKYSDAIFVDSELGKQHVVESYKTDPSKVFVLPFVTPPYVDGRVENRPQQDIRQKFNLPERYIFYPAQLWHHKNHIGIISALGLLRDEGIIVNAVFCGSDKNAGNMIFEAVRSQKLETQVRYLQYVSNEDIVELYRNAVALVMPSFFGPTNIPPLEAFVLGCPVAVADVYAMAEQVGDAALLFNPHDKRDIAEKIKLLWTNEHIRQDLIQKGYLKAAKWNQSKFSQRLWEIIDDVLSKS